MLFLPELPLSVPSICSAPGSPCRNDSVLNCRLCRYKRSCRIHSVNTRAHRGYTVLALHLFFRMQKGCISLITIVLLSYYNKSKKSEKICNCDLWRALNCVYLRNSCGYFTSLHFSKMYVFASFESSP